jgi:hypothetical protein
MKLIIQQKVDHRQLISVGYRWYQPTTVICTSTEHRQYCDFFFKTIKHVQAVLHSDRPTTTPGKNFNIQLDENQNRRITWSWGTAWMDAIDKNKMKNRSAYHSQRFYHKIQVQSVQNDIQSINLNQKKTYNNFEQLSASKSNVINKK